MPNDNVEFKDAPNPYWVDSSPAANYPVLQDDISVDVAIVGGGITGLTAAYLLTREGVKVAVIEADKILHGTTGHTTAKITSQHSLIYARLLKEKGEEMALQYADANEKAIQTMADIVKEHNIDCDFERCPAYIYTQSDRYMKDLEDEVRAACRLQIKASLFDQVPLPFPVKSALCFDNQAQFHPLKYGSALASELSKKGGYIFEQTRAMSVEKGTGKDYQVITESGKRVNAGKIIVASHFPFFDGGGLYFSRIYAERSYVIAATVKEKFPEGMFISAEDPTRSLRSQKYNQGELVLIGGDHHKTGQCDNTNLHYSNLLEFAHKYFEVLDVPFRWSAQDCMTMDGIPYVGHLTSQSPDIYVATGFGKWGMTNSTVSAMILKDLIIKGHNPWAQVYNPHRAPSVKNFVTQNVDVAVHYVSGKLAPMAGNENIEVGEARVIGVNGSRAGAYRDENDNLHVVDITCTHMGCELQWNDAEKSWDCPCHGSRFDCEGRIYEGPALNHLLDIKDGPNKVEPNVYQ